MAKTLADQIKDLENTRAAKSARMNEVMEKSIQESRSTEEAEAQEFDDLEGEIKQLDQDLVRLRKLERMHAANAQPVEPDATKSAKNFGGRGPTIIVAPTDENEKFAGQNFTRIVIAKCLGQMQQRSPIAIAADRWGKSSPTLVNVIKADVAGHGSGAGEAGAELVSKDAWTGDFIDYLYGMTAYNKLPLREAPANVTIKGQDGAATGYWVGESKSIPVSVADFNDVTLSRLKVAALSVISKELLKDSSPSAEMLIRDALAESCSQRIDTTFFSAVAGVAGVSPAGILNGVTALASGGNDGEDVLNDIKAMIQTFITARNSGGLWHAMNPALATSLSLMRNALDQREFSGLTELGGMLEGRNVVTGDNIDANAFITLKPSDIYRIGLGGLEITTSEHATIEMNDAPVGASDTPVASGASSVGMFQTESMAIKAVMPINFARRRESAVSWINDADYGAPVTP